MCIHGLDSRFCSLCQRAGKVVETRRSARTRKASEVIANEILRYSFSGDHRVLLLVPDIEKGWRFHTRTACFFERVTTDSMHDRCLSAQVALFPRPGLSDHSRTADWLPRLSLRSGHAGATAEPGPIRYRVVDGRLDISVDLIGSDEGFNPGLGWLPGPSGRPQVHRQERELLSVEWCLSAEAETRLRKAATEGALASLQNLEPESLPTELLVGPWSEIELQLLLIAEPKPIGSAISIDWTRRFFPGGLPSLGKRG